MSFKNVKSKTVAVIAAVTMLGSLLAGGVFISAAPGSIANLAEETPGAEATSTPAEPEVTADPVVYHEGFETVILDGGFAGFGSHKTNVNLLAITEEEAHTGAKSLKFAANWQSVGTQCKGDNAGATVFKPNTDYIFSFWVKGNFYKCTLYTPSDTGNNNMVNNEVLGGAAFDQWTEIKIPFRVGTRTTMVQGVDSVSANKPFDLYFQNAFTEMYLDDLTITEGTLPTASPTEAVTATPTPTTSTPTSTTVTKTAYVPVSKVAVAKVAGTTKTTAKVTVYKKAAANKGKWTTVAKNKAITVKSVSGSYAKVTVKVKGKAKTGYVKVSSLKFGKTQTGKVTASTKTYKAAATNKGYYTSLAKNKTFTIKSIKGNYYVTSVKVTVKV